MLKSILITIGVIAVGVLCFFWGRSSEKSFISEKIVVKTDTLWAKSYDTVFVEKSVNVVRLDTVKLAVADTLFVHDSVFVEIPIEEKEFVGENYRIFAEGYKVFLKSVEINYPIVTNEISSTVTRQKRWGFGAGVQVGYGYTGRGWSPYAGLGFSFNYNF